MANNEKSKSEERRLASQEAAKEAEKKGAEEAGTEASTETGAPAEPKVQVKTAPLEDDVVEVSKTDLKNFLKRMEDLEESNRRLLAVADKGRIFALNEAERKTKQNIPTVKLTRIGSLNGKLVVAWRMTRNESYVDGNKLIEHQEMEVFYQDGTTERMPLIEFYRKQNKDTIAKIRALSVNDEGVETLRLELPNGDLIEVGLKFVN